jgi:hypothetical protein
VTRSRSTSVPGTSRYRGRKRQNCNFSRTRAVPCRKMERGPGGGRSRDKQRGKSAEPPVRSWKWPRFPHAHSICWFIVAVCVAPYIPERRLLLVCSVGRSAPARKIATLRCDNRRQRSSVVVTCLRSQSQGSPTARPLARVAGADTLVRLSAAPTTRGVPPGRPR